MIKKIYVLTIVGSAVLAIIGGITNKTSVLVIGVIPIMLNAIFGICVTVKDAFQS